MSSDLFDPREAATTVIGELSRNIQASPREQNAKNGDVFGTALLLQAGLRGLLGVNDREGIAKPRTFDTDPAHLQVAQKNVIEVLDSKADVTSEQREIALTAIGQSVKELEALGYKKYADQVFDFANMQNARSLRPGQVSKIPGMDHKPK